MPVEYLDPSIANEGMSANNFEPGMAWANSVALSDDEWQPDIEPPRVNDYAAFKKHKHYGKYFRPYRYQPFPAWMYHPTEAAKLVDHRFRDGTIDNEECKKTVMRLGEGWRREPYPKHQAQLLDKTGKSHPVKTDTQNLAEAIRQGLAGNHAGTDANSIAAIVAAVMTAMQSQGKPEPAIEAAKTDETKIDEVATEADIERQAALDLAEKNGVKIDKRWSTERIKTELGL